MGQLGNEATFIAAVGRRAGFSDLYLRNGMIDLKGFVRVRMLEMGYGATALTSLDQQRPVELLIISAST